MLHLVLLASIPFVQHFHVTLMEMAGMASQYFFLSVIDFLFYQLFEDVFGIEEICLSPHSYLVSDIPFLTPTEV